MPATDIRTALLERSRIRDRGSWWNILKLTASEWVDDDAMTWAAAVACYTLLALAPMLVIAIEVATVMLGGKDQAVVRVQSQVQSWMGPDAAKAIVPMIDRIIHQGGGKFAAVVSIVLVILGVGGLFSELQQAMNRIWKLKPRPGTAVMTFVRARLKSVIVMTVAAIMLVASILVTTWLENTSHAIGLRWRYLASATNAVVSVGVLTLLFALLYKTIPDADIEWRSTAVGAIISAVLFEIGKFGLACYFKLAAPSSAFGAAGSLAAVLIWVYYSAQIVFFGAEFTQVYAKTRGSGVRPSKHAQFLSTCDETETATPSSKPPEDKPPRPSFQAGGDSPADYAGVLSQGLRSSEFSGPSAAPPGLEQRVLVRNLLAAGAGLAVGAVIGGLGSSRIDGTKPATGALANAALSQRMKLIEQKIGRGSRFKRRLAQDELNERIDALSQQVRKVARNSSISPSRAAATGWLDLVLRTLRTMK